MTWYALIQSDPFGITPEQMYGTAAAVSGDDVFK